jgi:alpha/beta superfamily hydrolase
MQTEEIIEEKISFDNNGLTLMGVLAYPFYQEPVRAVLLCSPHPHFAGNMDNNIITELAKFMANDSATLRFDYRGVGDSRINLPEGVSSFDYWDSIEEYKDYTDALCDVRSASKELARITENLPQIVIGYSFGAATAFMYGLQNDAVKLIIGISPPFTKVDFTFLSECKKPAFIILGKDDFLYTCDAVDTFSNTVSPTVKIDVLDDCDHFFRDREKLIAKTVYDFIKACNI